MKDDDWIKDWPLDKRMKEFEGGHVDSLLAPYFEVNSYFCSSCNGYSSRYYSALIVRLISVFFILSSMLPYKKTFCFVDVGKYES